MRPLPTVALLLLSTTTASGNVDPPPAPPPASHAAPYSDVAAYCASLPGARCEIDVDAPNLRGAAAAPFRAVQIVAVTTNDGEHGIHVLIETGRGWYGRELVSASGMSGGSVSFDQAALTDAVGDAGKELYVEATTSRDPCGCGDPHFDTTYAMVCRVLGDELSCTAPIVRGVEAYGAEIRTYRADWTFRHDGFVERTLRDVVGLSPAERRALERPLWLQFER